VRRIYAYLSDRQIEALSEMRRRAGLKSDSEALSFCVAFTVSLLGEKVRLLSPETLAKALASAYKETLEERERRTK